MPRSPIRRGLAFDDVLLVPQRSAVAHRADVDLTSVLAPGMCLGVPIVSANTPWCTEAAMAIAIARCGGLGVVHRMCTAPYQAQQVAAVKAAAPERGATLDRNGRLQVAAAIGVRDDWSARAELLVAAGADALVIDIAHGHSDHAIGVVQALRSRHPALPIIAGNVATCAAVRDLAAAGASVVKVGIGPGSVCTTRSVAGAGVPQLTAILDCAEQAARLGVRVIADGGIRTSGDIVKALAAGAAGVMLGGLLAGADESSAVVVEDGGERFKITTGFVSLGAKLALARAHGERVTRDQLREYVPEGIEATFPCRGPVAGIVRELCGGVRSGLSYSGAGSLAELRERAELIEVTAAGRLEGEPHARTGCRQVHPDFTESLVE